ncbi:HalOD1 output domain-containing protein [Natronococcus sp.]|uniref:HalOD1 output domain-containing protein n=1 Tax=Natronococcus sp. TaxID=35747 RepID=UPI0025FF63DF|nr:HalOD1 output domain-containing protein [Natronococcus sp.]
MIESEPYDDPPEPKTKPSLRVVERIAEAEGADPAELKPPLGDVVDASALDRLFEPTGRDDAIRRGSVSFRYCGYDVTIRPDGRVTLE